ncbi:hypothetical protein BO94DRAFT_555034 [Aspergillus sclerotioniger CBS 115572]|uniref:Uncharacterized protein n=1 Tax=Aspergillus sclerotioniger CBS 115572 TaxID=1450535 RepID=A0A317X5N7_9EURO|nr:hypothetical protein BO94DRAFT_555034 [Aspergillus sclerotioniger CBS 115572]PWY91860.1 hypothetical protein BO94DRAFT_555034 [Aspergillus sclerotioniger CBS 115572]
MSETTMPADSESQEVYSPHGLVPCSLSRLGSPVKDAVIIILAQSYSQPVSVGCVTARERSMVQEAAVMQKIVESGCPAPTNGVTIQRAAPPPIHISLAYQAWQLPQPLTGSQCHSTTSIFPRWNDQHHLGYIRSTYKCFQSVLKGPDNADFMQIYRTLLLYTLGLYLIIQNKKTARVLQLLISKEEIIKPAVSVVSLLLDNRPSQVMQLP